jgi:hypothetical protein
MTAKKSKKKTTRKMTRKEIENRMEILVGKKPQPTGACCPLGPSRL